MTDQNLTEIICVIDRSGSMGSIRHDAIGGFNTFLEDQKKVTVDKCLLTYTQFDNEYEVVHESKPIEDVPPLDESTYEPRGSTALLDAIGRTIDDAGKRFAAMPEEKRPGAVVFVILTDGHENASRKYAHEKIMNMIQTQRDAYNWQFIFLAAGQDAIAAGTSLGIGAAFAANFAHSAKGVHDAYNVVSSNVSNYRGTRCSSDLQMGDDVSDDAKGKVVGRSSGSLQS